VFTNTKCECGHQNYTGTVLCESCGKPLVEEDGTEPLEMRYDGVARRSQRENKSWIDKIWSFFSSVKIAVYIIFITLCLSMLGTIYPQESAFINMDPRVYYEEEYGLSGKIYYLLGLSHTYESWWFRGLLVMIGTSLVICSIDRVLPLYRALSKQKIRKHTSFIRRQKVVYSGDLPKEVNNDEKMLGWIEQFSGLLKKKRYRVHTEGSALMAEKNRFSRWGPYINHIGLIIFLLAVLMRFIPGWHMDQHLSIVEGETVEVPGTHYYLKNEEFILEYYSPEELSKQFREEGRVLVKRYETRAVLYECIENCNIPGMEPKLEEVKRHDIIVNQPLKHEGLLAYQIDYDLTPQIRSVNVTLKNKENGQAFGKFLLHMNNPQEHYEVGSYQVNIINYYPDYGYKEDGTPTSLSPRPNAPAFVFLIKGPELPPEGEVHMYFPKPGDKVRFQQDRINAAAGSPFELSAESMEDVDVAVYTTFLNLRIDRAMPFIWIGAAISMIGLIMGFYWQHRRIWLKIDEGRLLLGAHTNKNWYGIRNEVADALTKLDIHVDPKTLENEVKSK
jgi:cytochrome c biogenesis protein